MSRGGGADVTRARDPGDIAGPADDRLRPEDAVFRSVDRAFLAGRPGADLPHARPDGRRRLDIERVGGAGKPTESQGASPDRCRSGRACSLAPDPAAAPVLPRALPDPALLRRCVAEWGDRGVAGAAARVTPGAPGALSCYPAAAPRRSHRRARAGTPAPDPGAGHRAGAGTDRLARSRARD